MEMPHCDFVPKAYTVSLYDHICESVGGGGERENANDFGESTLESCPVIAIVLRVKPAIRLYF